MKSSKALEKKASKVLAKEHGVTTKHLFYIGDTVDRDKTLMYFNLIKEGHPKNKSTLGYVRTNTLI